MRGVTGLYKCSPSVIRPTYGTERILASPSGRGAEFDVHRRREIEPRRYLRVKELLHFTNTPWQRTTLPWWSEQKQSRGKKTKNQTWFTEILQCFMVHRYAHTKIRHFLFIFPQHKNTYIQTNTCIPDIILILVFKSFDQEVWT